MNKIKYLAAIGLCVFSMNAAALHTGPYDLNFNGTATIGGFSEGPASLHLLGEIVDEGDVAFEEVEWRFLGGTISFPDNSMNDIDLLSDLRLLDVTYPTYIWTNINGEGAYTNIPSDVILSGDTVGGESYPAGLNVQFSTVPLPGAVWLFVSGVLTLLFANKSRTTRSSLSLAAVHRVTCLNLDSDRYRIKKRSMVR